jgi:hypothetical protein
MELGRAIREWSDVENSLRYAALQFLSTDLQRKAMSVGFFSIDSFRAKLQFVDELVSRAFANSPLLPDWKHLVDRACRAWEKRNKLAHMTVREYPDQEAGRRVQLVPWRFPKPKPTSGPKKPPPKSLELRLIVESRRAFTALACAIRNWIAHIEGKAEPYPKNCEQAAACPPVAELVAELLREARTVFK